MIIDVPVYGPMAGGLHHHLDYGARERCLGGWQCLQSANMHWGGVGLTRVRCQHDVQGRECPSLHVCAYEHWQPVNYMQLRFVIGIDSSVATVCCREEVGVRGRGLGPGQGQFSGHVLRLQQQSSSLGHTWADDTSRLSVCEQGKSSRMRDEAGAV